MKCTTNYKIITVVNEEEEKWIFSAVRLLQQMNCYRNLLSKYYYTHKQQLIRNSTAIRSWAQMEVHVIIVHK